MKQQLLYKDLAKYYDLIYSEKNYEKEALIIKELISRYKKSDGVSLLDVACGTGHHIKLLKDEYFCTGLDINEGILQIARENVEDVEFIQADMTSFNLGRKFDVITCLFSSIGYVKTYQNLSKTMKNFYLHMRKGAVLLIEPWFTKEVYSEGFPFMTTYDGDNVKIARLNISERCGNISIMDMHYLIAEKNLGVKHYVERHELGLFEADKTLEIMEEAGFQVKFLMEGALSNRGLYIGVKQ